MLFKKYFERLPNSKSSMKTLPWNVKLHYNVFYVSWNKKYFNENEYNKLCPSGSAPARIYGTPKMHKFSSSDSFPKFRPIALSVSTFDYNLAHFLCHLFSPLVPNDYSYKYTFSFLFQIKNANLPRKFLVSYDVTSLFNNIPLQKNIDTAINLIFNHNLNLNITKK